MGPETALRLLRDIKPSSEDLAALLHLTHLDELFAEAAETLRQAGFESTLSAATKLVWTGEIAQTVRVRRAAELQALSYAISVLQAEESDRMNLAAILRAWQKAIDSGNLREAVNFDREFHEMILRISQRGAHQLLDEALASAYEQSVSTVISGLGLIGFAYFDLLESPFTSENGNGAWEKHYTGAEEQALLDLHKEICSALLEGDLSRAEFLMSRHFDWLWYEFPPIAGTNASK